jgi:hypothetical protein
MNQSEVLPEITAELRGPNTVLVNVRPQLSTEAETSSSVKEFFNIGLTNSLYDPLTFPLLFPFGQGGWHPDYTYGPPMEQQKVTMRNYYRYFMFLDYI